MRVLLLSHRMAGRVIESRLEINDERFLVSSKIFTKIRMSLGLSLTVCPSPRSHWMFKIGWKVSSKMRRCLEPGREGVRTRPLI